MLRGASVLIVDDEEVMREILHALLDREGCKVSVAVTGEDGLALARAKPFDVAIVDVMMPGLDGIATLDELKGIDEDLPVILITAFAVFLGMEGPLIDLVQDMVLEKLETPLL